MRRTSPCASREPRLTRVTTKERRNEGLKDARANGSDTDEEREAVAGDARGRSLSGRALQFFVSSFLRGENQALPDAMTRGTQAICEST